MDNLTFPDKHCKLNPKVAAHHYVEAIPSIFVCKYCQVPLWQPRNIPDASRFSTLIATKGLNIAYSSMLTHRPKAREALLVFAGLAKVQLTKAEVDEVIEKLELDISAECVTKHVRTNKLPFNYKGSKKRRWNKSESPVYT